MTKSLCEMSEAELHAHLEHLSGIRTPKADAPRVEWSRWMVAYHLALSMRHGATPEEATADAFASVGTLSDFARYRPYLEEALGRPLTAEELACVTGRKFAEVDMDAVRAAMARAG